MNVKNGGLQFLVDKTEHAILEETMARRTHDESGNYTIKPFQIQMKESVELNERLGVYTAGDTTDDNFTAANNFVSGRIEYGKSLYTRL